MTDLMQQYLLSLGLEDVDQFDMDFTGCKASPDNPDQIDLFITKITLWDYSSFRAFCDALSHVQYPYSLQFFYEEPVTLGYLKEFFLSWSLENYCLADCPFEFVSFADGVLRLRELNENEADEEEHCRIVESFRDLLHFIGYASDVVLGPVGLVTADGPFIPEEEMPQFYADSGDTPYFAAEEPVQEKPVAQPEPAKPVSEEGVEMVFTDEEGQALIIANYEAAIASGESALLEMERANTKRMLEERHRDRVNRRGGYEVLRSLNDVYTMRMGNVDFDGIVFEAEVRTSRKGTVFGRYGIGRGDGAVSVTAFANKANPESLIKSIAKGWHVRVRGAIDLDRYSNQRIIKVHYLEKLSPIELRKDEEEEKRVELHLHTNMSTMDGLPDFSAYYDLARNMGMKAIAVTDHGVVQSFPAAQDARDKHKKAIKENNLDEKELKIIYGSELYMFDMHQQYVHNPAPIPLAGAKYCIFDTETTGLSARYDRIVEFGCVIVEPGKSNVTFDTFVNPEIDLRGHEEAMTLNKISEEQVRNAPTFREIWPKIQECFEGCILVAHNANFDVGFLNAALEREGLPPLSNPIIDTIPISHYLFPNAGRHNEEAMLKNLGLGDVYDASDAHRADYDSIALNEGWQEIVSRLNKTYPGITHADLENLQVELPDLDDVKRENADQSNFDRFLRASNKFMPFWHNLFPKDNIPLRFATYEEAFALLSAVAEPDSPLSEHYASVVSSFNGFCRHLREYHVMVLAKNMQGMKDLNKIVTQGHTTYLASVPKTPRHLIEAYRKNFLVGSACFSSEIFDIASTRNRNVLIEAMGFYDYIEIQPLENYSYLLDMGRIPSKDHLIELLKDIIEAAHAAGKPVVATGDVHYVDPEDKILRDIYIDAKAIGKGSHPLNPPARARRPLFDNPDQHFRSTREMLDSFRAWLPEDEAREYVITNSNRIADQIDENMSPVSKDLFPPNENLPHSDVQLRDLCYGNFHARYDYTFDDDPEVLDAVSQVKSRLDRELEGIIGHGYAVTYFIAHKLIKMANDEPEHYIVGSRGSVGSSFAATMADITEVNPLPPHYQCPHCHYLRFEDPKQYKSGFDLPDAKCPKCGHDLRGNGQHIPFETFLGFAADKVPDIDLNFEDESQHKAHNYTKELLGDRNVFRAGTIETVAEKTAYGFVRGYFEHLFERQGNGKRVDDLNPTYIAYLASRCQGVKRTTGQHPGGIVVVPKNMSVYDFTAVQHPANDLDSEWLTTHYDFSSMHDEILKFDILGHVDPMAMRHYRDLTKVRIEDIPMNDPKVLSLFVSNKELKMHRNYLGTVTGAAALPEFGTDLAQRMLETALPHSFNDLLILSGLSHGTDVWAGNAEDLIKSGTTDINGVIGCRDDIMTYLINNGIEKQIAFKIMEAVRRGKGLTPEWESNMIAHKIPEFYINSCKKIKYLFPRGHATAYVMMAVRVAYFKLYYPLQFYAVFFSIRSDAYDIESMIKGEEAIIAKIDALRARSDDRVNPLSNKELDQLKTLKVALEMTERGYSFKKIDLYRSEAKMFVVDEEAKALIPPFIVLDGLGEAAGQSVVDARNELAGREFLSKEQLHRLTKLTDTNIKQLEALGSLEGLSDTNQLTLF